MSRVEAMTTNLKVELAHAERKARDRVSERGGKRGGVSYLWKTETQLRGPEHHFAWYFLKSGLTDSRNGPMKGVLSVGPTIDPLFQMYLTMRPSAMSSATQRKDHTLIVSHSREQKCKQKLPHSKAGENGGEEAGGIELLYHMGDFCVRRRRYEARVDRHLDVQRLRGALKEGS